MNTENIRRYCILYFSTITKQIYQTHLNKMTLELFTSLCICFECVAIQQMKKKESIYLRKHLVDYSLLTFLVNASNNRIAILFAQNLYESKFAMMTRVSFTLFTKFFFIS